MSSLTIKLPDGFESQLKQLTDDRHRKDVYAHMLQAAMKAVKPEIERRLKASIEHPDESTGDLLDSITLTEPTMDKHGDYHSYISFKGKGRNGTPNGQKAMSKEYGTSKELAVPFLRPAKAAKEAEAGEAMREVFSREAFR